MLRDVRVELGLDERVQAHVDAGDLAEDEHAPARVALHEHSRGRAPEVDADRDGVVRADHRAERFLGHVERLDEGLVVDRSARQTLAPLTVNVDVDPVLALADLQVVVVARRQVLDPVGLG